MRNSDGEFSEFGRLRISKSNGSEVVGTRIESLLSDPPTKYRLSSDAQRKRRRRGNGIINANTNNNRSSSPTAARRRTTMKNGLG